MERTPPDDADTGASPEGAEPLSLDQALRGRLPCVVCGYDLRGLSIRGVCPECGTAIRATILYKVDPQADELRPIKRPRLTSAALTLWALGALIAAVASWWPRVADFVATVSATRPASIGVSWLAVGATGVSGAAIVMLLRPTRPTPWWKTLAALAALVAYAPLIWSMYHIQLVMDPRRPAPYLEAGATTDRLQLHLLFCASLVIIVLGMRPIARDFVRRSLAMRTKRVDRQTLLAMTAAVGVVIVGDLIRLAVAGGSRPDTAAYWTDLGGQAFVGLGFALFTLGMVGAVRDTWRLGRVILIPSPSLRQLMRGGDG